MNHKKHHLIKYLKRYKNGVKVIYVKDAQSIDEMYQTFKQLGKVTHREQQAEALIQDTKQNIKK